MPDTFLNDVFLSHSAKDKAVVRDMAPLRLDAAISKEFLPTAAFSK
jgi:hypothetical protein